MLLELTIDYHFQSRFTRRIMGIQSPLLFPIALLVLCYATCSSAAKNCTRVDYAENCPDNMVEIYVEETDTNKSGKERICCIPGTKDETDHRAQALSCRDTDCRDASDATPCEDGIWQRWVNGTKLGMVETVRDTCQPDKDGTNQVDVLCCPVNSTDFLLTTLLGVEPNEFPHFAAIDADNSLCGATVYNERYVITASHCVVNKVTHKPKDPKTTKIYLGTDILYSKAGDVYKAEEFHVYPNSTLLVKSKDHVPIQNDIALIRVNKDIKFGPNVKALPIAETDLKPLDYADHAVIIGFGDTDTLLRSQKLQKGNTVLRTDEDNLGEGGPYSDDHTMDEADKLLFVGGVQDGVASVTTGKGDSGGPAVCRDANGYATLCGLNSFGFPVESCEKHKDEAHCQPKAFVEVAYYRDWIISVAGDQKNAEVLKQPLYGKTVSRGEYESQVHITSRNGDPCGGTLIAKDVVLTAAHCVVNEDGSKKHHLRVSTGVREVGQSGTKTVKVKHVEVLDGFQRRGKCKVARQSRIAVYAVKPTCQAPYFRNNLALVKLKGEINISSKKIPKVASSDPTKSGDVWASEISLPLNSTKHRELSQREFHILDRQNCKARLDRLKAAGYRIKLDENIMCGVEKYTGGSLCDRQLGGGVFCKGSSGNEELCGVQTFRLCDFAVPSALLNLAKNKDWIEQTMNSIK